MGNNDVVLEVDESETKAVNLFFYLKDMASWVCVVLLCFFSGVWFVVASCVFAGVRPCYCFAGAAALLLLLRALAFILLLLLALALHRDHEGTLEYPGRTVTLEPTEGEVCSFGFARSQWGVAYKVSKKEDKKTALTKREAIRMYEDLTNGKLFKYEYCWEILITNPKWCSKELTKTNDSNKQKFVNDSNSPVSFSNQGDDYMNLNTPITEGINSDGVVRPQGRKDTKEKKRRLNDEKGVVEALCNLQSILEKQIKFNEEELELKKEKDKKEFELREQTMKKEIKLKEKAQKMKEKDQQLKEKNQRLKEKEQKMKEKAQKRQKQDCILNQDVNKLPLPLRSTFEIYQTQILKEWENDGLFGKVFTSSDDDK
ncbi:hypothetical protein EZV62_023596 [Acer yangbiense]|uniref:No apical meristem-associated C-terminal domain-containing protein n=1 Tax=Acer yangbiense TaxID=1000413 RepID=A0A5C7H3M0_9ROSI|nr:hypothetical protein EZV62_023596 [Acer yangbiense]